MKVRWERQAPRPATDDELTTAGTTRRFLLLLVMVMASCLFMLQRAAKAVLAWKYQEGCLLVSPAGGPVPCALSGVAFWAALSGTGLVALAAFGLYWWLPSWKSRPGRLTSVPNTTGEQSHLGQLTARAGIVHQPHFAVDPTALTAGAVVFGRMGQYTVCLHAGLLARRASDPKMFEAVVLHELAHIRNRDVDMAYATAALWRVFSLVVLLPYAAHLWWLLYQGQVLGYGRAWTVPRPSPLLDMVFCVFVAVHVYLAQTDLLRKRELYADLDAMGWGAEPAVWRRIQDPAITDGISDGGSRARLIAKLWSFAETWRTHPSWVQRHRSLTQPYGRAREALFGNDTLSAYLVWSTTLTLVQSWSGIIWEATKLTMPRLAIGIMLYPSATVWGAAMITVMRGAGAEHHYNPLPLPSGSRKDQAMRLLVLMLVVNVWLLMVDPIKLFPWGT